MVRCERPEDGLRITPRENSSRKSDGCGGLLWTRLSEDVLREQIGQLLLHSWCVHTPSHYHQPRRAREREQAVPRRLDERPAILSQVEEKFRAPLAREWPETRSCSACGDDGVEL
jgi:hypothetical protein